MEETRSLHVEAQNLMEKEEAKWQQRVNEL
jgi:hypothetical protein